MSRDTLVFCTDKYAELRDRVCEHGGLEAGLLDTHRFPDGESYWRIRSECEGRPVAVLGGTISETDTLAMYDIAYGAVGEGARDLTLVIPYFGYQTMERAARPGEVVTAKVRAHLLSSIPVASEGNRIVLMDVHSPGVPYYFEGHVRPVHLWGTAVVLELIRELGGEDFLLGATDAGRAKWVEQLANDLGVDAGFVFKRRVDSEQTEVTAMAADVKGRRVVIYDDMIRTGSSLIGAAKAYLGAGASSIAAVATHGVFPGDAAERLAATGLFSAIGVTDSHPRALEVAGQQELVRVRSVAGLVASLLTEGPHSGTGG